MSVSQRVKFHSYYYAKLPENMALSLQKPYCLLKHPTHSQDSKPSLLEISSWRQPVMADLCFTLDSHSTVCKPNMAVSQHFNSWNLALKYPNMANIGIIMFQKINMIYMIHTLCGFAAFYGTFFMSSNQPINSICFHRA